MTRAHGKYLSAMSLWRAMRVVEQGVASSSLRLFVPILWLWALGPCYWLCWRRCHNRIDRDALAQDSDTRNRRGWPGSLSDLGRVFAGIGEAGDRTRCVGWRERWRRSYRASSRVCRVAARRVDLGVPGPAHTGTLKLTLCLVAGVLQSRRMERRVLYLPSIGVSGCIEPSIDGLVDSVSNNVSSTVGQGLRWLLSLAHMSSVEKGMNWEEED